MTAEWYYAKNKQKVGPVTEAQLKELVRSGELGRDDMVWKQGMGKWTEAAQVEGLFPAPAKQASGPPPLPPDMPAPTKQRTSEDWWKRLLADKLLLVSACLAVSLLLTCLLSGALPDLLPVLSLANLGLLIAVAVFGFARFMRFARRDNLHGRWNPLEGDHPWIEFVRGGTLTRSDGYTASFRFNKDNTIDVWQDGKAGKTWKVISLGTHELVIQDQHGKLRRYRKGKTLEQKHANPFHKDRTDDLPGSWVPIDGSGKWVQFTKDGAIVSSEGGAGRYTVTGEEPNEIIRVTMADGSACEYRIMSLSKTQLVIVEGPEARTYSRQGQTKSAASSASHSGQEQGTPDDAPGDQGTGGAQGALAGFWNWLSGNWRCPKCKSRNTTEFSREVADTRQEVQTDWTAAQGQHRPQAVFNIITYHAKCQCNNCGYDWIQEKIVRLRA